MAKPSPQQPRPETTKGINEGGWLGAQMIKSVDYETIETNRMPLGWASARETA